MREHQQHPGALQILKKMLAWDALLEPGLKHTKDDRRKLAAEQGIQLPRSLRSKQFEGDFQQHICRHFSEDIDCLRSSMDMFAQRSSDHAATGHAASSVAGVPVVSANAQEASSATEHVADQLPASHPSAPSFSDRVVVDGRVGTLRPMELQPHEAPLVVESVKRVGENRFETTVADGTVHYVDRQTLETLPQGSAKRATRLVQEIVQARGKRRSSEPEAARAKQSPQRATHH